MKKDLIIEGYALMFGNLYYMGDYYEVIEPRALAKTDFSDVVALRDHNMSMLLGRNTAGTLKLQVDSVGLYYRLKVPSGTFGTDTFESVERGDLVQCSFGFMIGTMSGSEWENKPEPVRHIVKIDKIFDVTLTAFGANPKTKAWVRPDLDGSSLRGADTVSFGDYDPKTQTFIESRSIQIPQYMEKRDFKEQAPPRSAAPFYECASLQIQNEARQRVIDEARRMSGAPAPAPAPQAAAPGLDIKSISKLPKKQREEKYKELAEELESKRKTAEAAAAANRAKEQAAEKSRWYASLSEAQKLEYTRNCAAEANRKAKQARKEAEDYRKRVAAM